MNAKHKLKGEKNTNSNKQSLKQCCSLVVLALFLQNILVFLECLNNLMVQQNKLFDQLKKKELLIYLVLVDVVLNERDQKISGSGSQNDGEVCQEQFSECVDLLIHFFQCHFIGDLLADENHVFQDSVRIVVTQQTFIVELLLQLCAFLEAFTAVSNHGVDSAEHELVVLLTLVCKIKRNIKKCVSI